MTKIKKAVNKGGGVTTFLKTAVLLTTPSSVIQKHSIKCLYLHMYEHYMLNYFNVASLEIWHNPVTEKSWQNEQSVIQTNIFYNNFYLSGTTVRNYKKMFTVKTAVQVVK